MQQLILAALKPAKQAYANGEFDYIGGAGLENLEHKGIDRSDDPIPLDQLQARQGGEYYTLEEGVYDLRCTLRYLAIHWPKRWGAKAWQNRDRSANLKGSSYWFIDDAFRISFMRAARGLVDRGLLISCDDENAPQLRFVSLRSDLEREYEARKDQSPFEL